MKKITYLLILMCSSIFSQTGNLSGKITHNKKGIIAADIYIKNLKIGATSKKDGTYSISNIPSGKHMLTISYVGFKTLQKEILVKNNTNTKVNAELKRDVLGLDQVVVSATRSHLSRKKAPVIVTVTDKLTLEAVNSVSLSEGLSFQPGLRFETNCQNCGYSQVRINGLEGSYTQILVDSRPVFSALAGVYGLDQIPANTVERVEVIRGGGSALYGSSAIAGTINIITKDPTANTFQAASTLGLIGGKNTDFSTTINGTVVTEDYNAGLSFYSTYRRRNAYWHDTHAEITDADRTIINTKDDYTEMPKLRNKSFGAKGFLKPNDRSRISAEITVLNEFRRGGNKLNLLPFQTGITEQIASDVLLGSLTYETANTAKTTKYSAYLSGSYAENENYYGGKGDLEAIEISELAESLSYGTSKDKVLVGGLQMINSFDKDILTIGIEQKFNKTNDIKTALSRNIEQVLNTTGLYAQYEWNLSEEFKILAGLRGDYYNVTNHNRKDLDEFIINPRLNLMYSTNDNLRFRASYAKGFRAPQFFADDLHVAIAAGETQQVVLDENLKSEVSHSFTGSIDWSKNYEEGAQLMLTFEPFYTILDNPFALDPLDETPEISVKTNGDKATIYGTNLEVKYTPNNKYIFQGGLTVQKGAYKQNVEIGDSEQNEKIYSKDFMRSPSVYGNLIFTYAPVRNFQNNLSGVFTGSMYVDHTIGEVEHNGQTIEEAHRIEQTPSFFELNWKSSYNFDLDDHKHLQLQVNGGVQNMFNAYQEDFDMNEGRDAGYVYGPSRPRTFFVGLKIGTNL